MGGMAKKKTGSPTKYKSSYIDRVDIYIRTCLRSKKAKEQLPTQVGFAIYLNVVVETLKNWGEKNPEFLVALSKIHEYQKRELINRGLLSTYNSTITKLLLSANHGVIETTGQEHDVSKELRNLLGLIDGSSKGRLPSKNETESQDPEQ